MNWRKSIIKLLLILTNSKIILNYNYILSFENKTRKEIKIIREKRLKDLLIYSWNNVPHYTRVLEKAGVIKDGLVNLKNFSKIPILTKENIRKEYKNLCSIDCKERKCFANTSGGSTGEPIKLIQDRFFYEWMVATKLYFFHMAGKELGERELKLWGSERDILEGTIGIKEKLINFLYNRKFLNSFMMDEKKMNNYIKEINNFKPKIIWAYVESIFELAKFVKKNNLKVYSPQAIISTAGVLSPEISNFIEETFKTKVYNQYGSREVGDIAMSCTKKEGLHTFDWQVYLEIINGKIIITSLTNYSMPLIRYEIGDTANFLNDNTYCNLKTNVIDKLTGRITNHFVSINGSLVHGEYFSHLLYFKEWVSKFKIIQKRRNLIVFRIVKKDEPKKTEIAQIEREVCKVMGQDCKIKWDFVQNIPANRSGKFIYTLSEVKN